MHLFKSCIATGIALFVTLTMHSHECRATTTSTLTQPDITCADTSALDSQTAAFINMQCSIQSQIFPTATDATVIYKLDAEIQGVDSYDITAYGNQTGRIKVAWCSNSTEVAVPAAAVDYMKNVQARAVVGRLFGTAGDDVFVPVQCTAISYTNIVTGLRQHLLMVASISTDSVVEDYSVISRMVAGPRFVDSTNGKSYGMDAALPGAIVSSMAYPTDLTTVYCTFANVPAPSQADCIKAALNDHLIALAACAAGLVVLMAAATAAGLVMLAVCAANALLTPPPLNVGLLLVCVAAALAIEAIGMVAAFAAFAICAAATAFSLKSALRACGTSIYEA